MRAETKPLVVVVLMALACTAAPDSDKSNSTGDTSLTRDLVKGLLNSYANSEAAVGEGCLFLKSSERPSYYLLERDSATLDYSASNGKWVWIATGVGCSGIQKWEIDDTTGEVVHIPSPKTAKLTPVPTAIPTWTPAPPPTVDYGAMLRSISTPTRTPMTCPQSLYQHSC